MIESYLREVRRWLVGTANQKDDQLAELAAHLREAEEVGELDDALARLGSARKAAAAFSPAARAIPAALSARAVAALIDYLPLLVASVAVAAFDINDGGSMMISFPAGLRLSGDWGLWRNLVMPVALVWSVIGVGVIEARTGWTPGKRLARVQTVSEDGTAVALRQALCRRVPVLFGPFLWLDVLFVFLNEQRRRAFDVVAHTRVVASVARAGTPRERHHTLADA